MSFDTDFEHINIKDSNSNFSSDNSTNDMIICNNSTISNSTNSIIICYNNDFDSTVDPSIDSTLDPELGNLLEKKSLKIELEEYINMTNKIIKQNNIQNHENSEIDVCFEIFEECKFICNEFYNSLNNCYKHIYKKSN